MVAFDPDRLDARDPDLIRTVLPAVRALTRRYLRLEREGLEHVPAGPALLVGNHNGGILGPDVPCTMRTLWETIGPEAPLYGLAHDFAMRQLTPLGRLLQRFGGVRASPHNAARILEAGGKALVYPGGDLEAYRRSSARDRIVLGERSGFVRVARAARVPIVPIVAQGAHRSAWVFTDGAQLARMMRLHRWARLDRFPLALALPWGLAVGPWIPYLPLPFRVRLRILPPISVGSDDDDAEVRDYVRARMQAALNEMVAQ
jgi:1-acyl-sn-glycerol-3-phosphate acyltransferase